MLIFCTLFYLNPLNISCVLGVVLQFLPFSKSTSTQNGMVVGFTNPKQSMPINLKVVSSNTAHR